MGTGFQPVPTVNPTIPDISETRPHTSSLSGQGPPSIHVVFPRRAEDVQGACGAVTCFYAVDNVGRNSVKISIPYRPGFAIYRKLELSFQNHPHLLVRVRMIRDDGVRLEINNGQHSVFTPKKVEHHTIVKQPILKFMEFGKVLDHGS